ncbi:MAG: flagellin [Planctomycetes bacterium]|nr:flagellin [Planctomycetota bacterium]
MGLGLSTTLAGQTGALTPLSSLHNISSKLLVKQKRLATGLKLNSAGDDPAGLILAVEMRARSEGLRQAMDNIQNAQNLLATAEDGLMEIQGLLGEMKAKALAAANDTFGDEERAAIQEELRGYARQIDRVANHTTFNGKKLLDGLATEPGKKLVFHVGADANDQVELGGLNNVSAAALGIAATATQPASASIAGDAAAVLAAAAAAPVSNENLGELATGEYLVEVVYGTTAAAGDASYLRLMSKDGQALLIDTQDGGNAVDTVTKAVDLSGTGTAAADLGNGLKVILNKIGEGAAKVEGQVYTVTVDYTAQVASGFSAQDAHDFAAYAKTLQDAYDKVTAELSKVAGVSKQLDHQEGFTASAFLNLQESLSRIADADIAEEQGELERLAASQQSTLAVLAQANLMPDALLALLS